MLRSFRYAFNGIAKAIATQRNLRFHLLALLLVVGFGYYFQIERYEWIAIVICSGMVIGAEIMNTAIEETVNYISPSQHPKAGLIKDLSAGAVLVLALLSVVVAGIIFIPKIVALF